MEVANAMSKKEVNTQSKLNTRIETTIQNL